MNAQEIASQLKDQDLNLVARGEGYIEPDEADYFGSDYDDVEILSHIKDRYYVAMYQGRMVIASLITVPDNNEADVSALWELPNITNRHFKAEEHGYNYKFHNSEVIEKLSQIPVSDGHIIRHEADTWIGWIRPYIGGYIIQTQSKPYAGVRDYDLMINTEMELVILSGGITMAMLERKLKMMDALLSVTTNA